jgi:hypothetical protein
VDVLDRPANSRHASIGRLVAAGLAALGLVLLASGQTLASGSDRYGIVAIVDADAGSEVVVDGEPHVCDFFFRFDLNEQSSVVGWNVRTWNPEPLDGSLVLKGKGGPTNAAGQLRQPVSGSLSVPDGHYNVVWDDEDPVDASNGAESFVVDCSTAIAPTPTPTRENLPGGRTGPTKSPRGGVEAVVGTPKVTLPATDTANTTAAARDGSSTGFLVVAGLVLVGSAALLLLTPQFGHRRVMKSRRAGRQSSPDR